MSRKFSDAEFLVGVVRRYPRPLDPKMETMSKIGFETGSGNEPASQPTVCGPRLRGLGAGRQVMPLTVKMSYLENVTLVGIEEVASVRNTCRTQHTHGTTSPLGRRHSFAIGMNIFHVLDSVSHVVGDTQGLHRNQPPTSLQFV